jgi:Tfp pilus assembly protein FimT
LGAVRNFRSSTGFTVLETLLVVGLIGIISAIALPMFERTVGSYRLVGTARSVSNQIAVAKIRAASNFSRARIFVDLSSNTHHLELLDRSVSPAHWTTEGGATYVQSGVEFGYGSISSPPPNSQDTIAQATPCTQDDGTVIANTACITFNSRGIPVDGSGAPEADGVLYVTDGSAVYGVTVAATGMIRLWRTYALATAMWELQ